MGVGKGMYVLWLACSQRTTCGIASFVHLYVGFGHRTQVLGLHSRPLNLLSRFTVRRFPLLYTGDEIIVLAHLG